MRSICSTPLIVVAENVTGAPPFENDHVIPQTALDLVGGGVSAAPM